MRLSCLTCGNQVDVAPEQGLAEGYMFCVCGTEHAFPELLGPVIHPDEHAADASRVRAFRAAGLSKNYGGAALWMALGGILLPPLSFGALGAIFYVFLVLRKAARPFSGHRLAWVALAVCFTSLSAWGVGLDFVLAQKSMQERMMFQEQAPQELEVLYMKQLAYHHENARYGSFKEIRFKRPFSRYTLYLGESDFMESIVDGQPRVFSLPMRCIPSVGNNHFTAFAVANLDEDQKLDVWQISETGKVVHQTNDFELD